MLKSSAPASGFESAVRCDASSSSSTWHLPITVRSLGNSIVNTPKSTPTRANELRQPIAMSALVDSLVIIGRAESQTNAEDESPVKLKTSEDEKITLENEGWVMQKSISNSNKSNKAKIATIKESSSASKPDTELQ